MEQLMGRRGWGSETTSYFGASLDGWVEPMSTWSLMALASAFFCTDNGRERLCVGSEGGASGGGTDGRA
jgi:hypothetical protein